MQEVCRAETAENGIDMFWHDEIQGCVNINIAVSTGVKHVWEENSQSTFGN